MDLYMIDKTKVHYTKVIKAMFHKPLVSVPSSALRLEFDVLYAQ